MAPHNDIILFHYSFSTYARKVIWYLTLSGIDYAQCLQPPYLPREDLNALGVKYRRIPVLSIGRDIYCDTRLIIQKLEERFSSEALEALRPDQKAVEKLLQSWTGDGGIFWRVAQVMPPETPLLKDPKFLKDREDYVDKSLYTEDMEVRRPEAWAHLRDGFEFLENGLLADGRKWILKTQKPSLADIEAIWPFHWLVDMGTLPASLISKEKFPRVFAWVHTFNEELNAAKASSPKPTTYEGAEAVKYIVQADFAEVEGSVDANDPLKLQKSQEIESWPIDSGFRHHDRGRLVTLTSKEVVLASQSKDGGKEVRIHHPRWNFRIRAVDEEATKH